MAITRQDIARPGRCYELSGRYILNDAAPDAVLVHGSIQGFGHPRIAHAWVEDGESGIWEPVTDEHYPPEVFAALFNPLREHTYTSCQTSLMALKTKHWGPWNASPQPSVSPAPAMRERKRRKPAR